MIPDPEWRIDFRDNDTGKLADNDVSPVFDPQSLMHFKW